MSSEFVRDLAGLDFQTDDDTLPVSSVVKTLDEQIRQLEAAPRDKAAVFSIGDDEDEEEDEEEEEEEEGAGGFSMPAVGLLSELKVSTTSGAGQFFATPVFDGKEQPASSTTESSLSSVALSSPPVDTAQELAALSPVLVPDPAVAAPPQYSHTHQPSVERRAALEAAILAITQDNFPDTDALRAHLFELGRVPPELRLPVLSLLLTGSVSLDHEASTFSNPGHLLSITSTNALSRDCDDAIATNSLGGRGDGEAAAEAEALLLTDPVEARRSMFDLVSLLCCRRQVEYHALYLALLAPLLVCPQTPPRPLLSAAFYTLTTQFVPVLSLPPGEAAVRHVEHTHALLRLLVLYHSPRVVAHLDRVAWGWEGSLGEDKAAALLRQEARDAEPSSAGEKVLSHIDQLEAELGLDADDMPLTPTSAPEPDRSTPSEPSGLVPFHLIAGLFATCLPPPQAAMVIDWAVLLREPYAGVYLLAALLDIHTPLMLSLDRRGVERWFRGLASSWDWALLSGRPHGGAGVEEEELGPLPSHTAATAAWILAASSLRRATPAAFVAALQAGGSSSGSGLGGSLSPLSEQGAEEDDNRDSFLEAGQVMPASLGGSSHSSSPRMGGAPSASSAGASSSGPSVWTAVEEALPCLCSNVRRTLLPQQPRGVFQRFIAQAVARAAQPASEGVTSEDGAAAPEEMAVPPLLQYLSHLDMHPASAPDVPVFFGLDARLEGERAGGSFPKSLSLRIPDSFAEGGGDIAALQAHLASLVDELMPLCQAGVHLVLVAAGEGAVLRALRQLEAQKRRGFFGRLIGRRGDEGAGLAIDLSSLSAAQKAHYRAYSARLEAILHYLCIERGLPHVSVMAGGFYEAVRVIWEAERVGGAWRAGGQSGSVSPLSPMSPLSPPASAGAAAVALTLRGCLVDADLAVLEEMLEVGVVAGAVVQSAATTGSGMGAGAGPSSGETDPTVNVAGGGSLGSSSSSSSSNSVGGDGGGGGEAWRGLQRFSSVVGQSLKKAGSTIGSAASSSGARISSSISGRGGSSTAGIDTPSEPLSAPDAPEASAGPDKRPALPLPSLSMPPLPSMPQIALPPMPTGMSKIGAWFRSTAASAANSAAPSAAQDKGPAESLPLDDGFGPRDPEASSTGEGDAGAAERALALHRVHGARKGDRLLLTRAALPGAFVFAALKEMPSAPGGGAALDGDSEGEAEEAEKGAEGEEGSLTASYLALLGATAGVTPADLEPTPDAPPVPLLPRLLVVTSDRFIVLTHAGPSTTADVPLGSECVVTSNHHLSELVKMAFKKRDPDLVTLFLLSTEGTQSKRYRIGRKNDFVAVLQHNMLRFK